MKTASFFFPRAASFASVVLATLLLPAASHAQSKREGEDVIAQVLLEWEKRRADIRTVLCQVKGKMVVPKGRFTGQVPAKPGERDEEVPPTDLESDVSFLLHVDLENNHFRNECERQIYRPVERTFCPEYYVRTFDEKTFKMLRPRERNTGNGVGPLAKDPDLYLGGEDLKKYAAIFFEAEELPVLFAAAVIDYRPDPRTSLRQPLKRANFSFEGYAVEEGVRCAVLRRAIPDVEGGYMEMWVDVQRHAAIRRWITQFPEGQLHEIRVNYGAEPDKHMPTGWSITTTSINFGRVNKRVKLQVDSFAFNTPLDAEDLNLERMEKPGMLVEKYLGEGDKAKAELFKVNSDGSLSPYVPESREATARWWKVTLGSLLVVGIGVTVVLLVRRFRIRGSRVTN
jgi:hypothetical protein